MAEGQSLELPIGIEASEAQRITIAEPAKLTLPDDLVVEQFTDFFRTDDESRKKPARVWDAAWSLYRGEYDWSGKEDWQAKINIPKVRGIVDTAAASFKRALVRMKRFYHIESETRLGVEKGFYTMSLLDYWLERMNFNEEFAVGLKNGLITSTLVYKVWWDWVTTTEPRWKKVLEKQDITNMGIKVGTQLVPTRVVTRDPRTVGVLRIKAVDSYDMWVGPHNCRRIERATVNYSYLEAMAKKGVYDKDAVQQLISRGERSVEQQKKAQRRGENTPPQSRFERDVDIYHYWGDLYDDDGSVCARNIHYTVGGEGQRVVLRKPKANPFFHGKDPYVIGTPYIVPFSTYNRGIVEDIIGIAKMITELSALIIDGAQYDAIAAFEADTDLLKDPKNGLKKGIYPGIVVETKGFENPNGKPVVRAIANLGKVPQLALQVRQMLDMEAQLSSSVTNALRGQQIGADTLGEFQSIVSSANASLDDAARTVEETTVDEILEKSIANVYQFNEDYLLPRLTEQYPQTSMQIVDMTPEERYATMVGGYSFKARGVSIMMDKAQDLKQIDSFVKLASAIPGLMTRINPDELLENIIVGIGWNPSRILLNPSSQPVYPAAMMGGQPVPGGPMGFMGGGMAPGGIPLPQGAGPQNPNLTPAQIVAGQRGATEGGARNNPMAQ